MAHRDLVVGDDVKISDVEHEMHGAFGVVTDVAGPLSIVKIENHGRIQGYSTTFHCDRLILADRNVRRDYVYDDEDEELADDEQVMRSLLERVSKLEKEILDMKSQRQYN